MRDDDSSSKTTGSALLEERRKLEVRQPGLAKGYHRFLKDFADYQAVQRQFVEDHADAKPERRPSLAARPR
jgi:hypothetical protein